MIDENNQSIGYICCDQQIAEDVFLGHIEFPEGQQRPCVLQFLPDGGGDLGRRRFTREAMIGLDMSRDHENLLSVMHFGVWQDGRLFMAVDYTKGRSVAQMLPVLNGQYRVIEGIVHTVLRALHYLHSRGVVHGGVVAGNVQIGADARIRLGDFSQARRFPSESDEFEKQEEQKSDLRSLGGLLFELLTGRSLTDVLGSHNEGAVDEGAVDEGSVDDEGAVDEGSVDDEGAVDITVALECLPLDTPVELLKLLAHLLQGEDPLSPDVRSATDDSTNDAVDDNGDAQAETRALAAGSAGVSYLSEEHLDGFVAKLMTVFAGLLKNHHEELLKELLARWPKADELPPFPRTSAAHKSESAPAIRLWKPAALGIALLALVIWVYTAARDAGPDVVYSVLLDRSAPVDTRPPRAPAEPTHVTPTPATTESRPDESAGESPRAVMDGLSTNETIAQRSITNDRSAEQRQRTKQPTGLRGNRHRGMEKKTRMHGLVENITIESSLRSTERVPFHRHESNARGIMLSVSHGTVESDDTFRLHTVIYNASRTEFHAAQFRIGQVESQSQSPRALRFEPTPSEACSKDGKIPPMARCEFMVWLDEPGIMRGRSITLTVSERQNRNSVAIPGLIWP